MDTNNNNAPPANITAPPANMPAPPANIRALHLHIHCTTPAGFQILGRMLLSLRTSSAQPPQAAQAALAPMNDEECPICRSAGPNCRLPCGHRFHNLCIRPWLLTHHSCADPYCQMFYVPDDIQMLD